jgi:hypothetical protein
MSRYRYRRLTGAEKVAIVFAVIAAVTINLAAAFLCIALPMILLHAPSWAWVGIILAAVYVTADGKS